MAKTKDRVAEMRQMGDAELLGRLGEARRELFNLRFQLATGQLDNSARLGEVRRDIARLATFLREREIAPHVSEYTKGEQNMAKNSLTEEERADQRRSISQKKRKLVEKVFGWAKLDSVLRQVKVRGLKRVDWFYRLTMAAYNLMRMRRLIPIEVSAS